MIHTDGTPTIANGAGDPAQPVKREPIPGRAPLANERGNVVVTAAVTIRGTRLSASEWRESVEDALKERLVLLLNSGDSIHAIAIKVPELTQLAGS